MKLNIQKANHKLTMNYFEMIEELGFQTLTMQTKRAVLMEHVDRLPHLFQWLKNTINADDFLIQSLNHDRDERYDEEAGHSQFHVAMEFFWIIERVSQAVMQKILVGEPQQIAVPSPELFNLWQSKFTDIPGIIPAKNCSEMLSLGQSYSVSGYRRLSRLPKSSHTTLANLMVGDLNYPFNEFRNLADATLPPTTLHSGQHQWVFENYEEFEDQSRHIVGLIHDFLREVDENENILFWLVDDDLNDRAMENFVLDEVETEVASDTIQH